MKKIIITRDSVAIGDDINSPHTKNIKVHPQWKIVDILNFIVTSNYLPKVNGGKATWSVAINEPIAVITQENFESPLLICHADYPHQGTKGFVDIQRIHFNYHAQKSAQEVFDVLLRFNLQP